MTLHTGNALMLARNLEGKDIVIEIPAQAVNAVVAIEARSPKR